MDATLSERMLYADRRRGILLIPMRRIAEFDDIVDATQFPLTVVCPDSIDTPEKAAGFVDGYLQARAGQVIHVATA